MIPVILITGFLGSGKTTFINWLLQKYPEKHISVILNEFGNIKLESSFVKNQSGDVVELANGCMCCVAKSDVPRVIKYILENSPSTELLLIEASGLSDPDPLKETLQSDELYEITYLQSTVCIIDSKNFKSTYVDHPLVLSQSADANVIVLSKSVMTSQEDLAEVRKILTSNIPDSPILLWDDNLKPEDLFQTLNHKEHSPEEKEEVEHHHLHEEYMQYWFNTDKKIDIGKLQSAFTTLSPMIYRAKGHVICADGSARLIQFVSGVFEVLPAEGTNITSTSILCLGETLDAVKIEEVLNHSIFLG
ncbi:MAG: CobW family GTP-binding protein [Candidatus Roizmanbacteria bacterium]